MGVVFIQQNIDMKKFLWVIGGVLMLGYSVNVPKK